MEHLIFVKFMQLHIYVPYMYRKRNLLTFIYLSTLIKYELNNLVLSTDTTVMISNNYTVITIKKKDMLITYRYILWH